jgi:L-rhamnose mutarotase
MEHHEVNALWQAEMAPFFDLPQGKRPNTGLQRLEEIFHLG